MISIMEKWLRSMQKLMDKNVGSIFTSIFMDYFPFLGNLLMF